MHTEPETPHEQLSAEQLDEAVGGATEPAPATKPVREVQTVQLLLNTT